MANRHYTCKTSILKMTVTISWLTVTRSMNIAWQSNVKLVGSMLRNGAAASVVRQHKYGTMTVVKQYDRGKEG